MQLNVMSFNIRCCDDKDGNSIAERAPRLKEILSRYDSDIIGLQEVTTKWMKHIIRDYRAEYEIYNKYRESGYKESGAILWKKGKFELLGNGYFWLSDTPETESRGWDEVYNCYRICTYVILRDKESGKEFTFMNTHFGFGDRCHADSADLIHRYSQEISVGLTVLVGDFNLSPSYPGYKRLTEHFVDTNAVTAKNMSNTFHDYFRQDIADGHIDFCFVRGNIKPIWQKIVDDTIEGKYPSDHFGVYTELEI